MADAFGAAVEHASAESKHFPADVEPGEDDASPEAVADGSVFLLVAKSRLEQEFLLVALAQCLLCQSIFGGCAVAQLELLHDVVAYAALAEVGHADGFAVDVVVEHVLEVVACKLVDHEKAFAYALSLFLLGGQFALLNLDVVFLGEPLQCFGVGHLLVLHDEVHGVAALSAGEAFAESLGRRYVERWCLVVVEGAQPDVVDPALFQCHEI